MERSDRYMNCGKWFRRFEIEGEPLTITEQMTQTRDGAKSFPTRQVRWAGLHRIQHGDEEYLAVHSVVSDSGPKLGVSVTVEKQREVPFTAEESAAGRVRIGRVMMDLFGCEVIWPGPRGELTAGEAEETTEG